MITIKKILVATDFSTSSTLAVKQALELAEAFGATIEVLHVVEEPFGYVGDFHRYLPEVDAFRETLNAAARAQLHQVLTPEQIEQFQASLSLRTGTPYAEIVRHARDKSVDLIVMGTRGRGPVLHMVMGSVAEKVVRYANCPVLTVRLHDGEAAHA